MKKQWKMLSNTNLNSFKICFQLGNVCTNNCSYCPAGCKDGSFPWPDLEKAKNIIKKIHEIYSAPPYNKKEFRVEFLGGEVTVWKEFDQLLEYTSTFSNIRNKLVTNGVRSVRWWKQNAKHFENITYSFHPEYDNVEHCLEVLEALSNEGVFASVLVLMLPSKWDFCKDVVETLKEKSFCQCITARTITNINDRGSRDHTRIEYTKEQLSYCRENSLIKPDRYVKLTFNDGVTYFQDEQGNKQYISPEEVINLHYNEFKNWKCFVGIDTIYLEQNGDIRRDAMCYSDKPIGSWKYDDLDELEWPVDPVTCPRQLCFCSHDLFARKEKYDK